ncbi:MAG: CoA pyrophosphatase [Thaumarchaeota archaeon]|nr:CoA pyrophosphatase [Nitrososphaerota archaeon]
MTSVGAALRNRLTRVEPAEKIPRETAAVAIIVGQSIQEGDRFLLIKRAERAGDPWSGQVAFPGGRVEQYDVSFAATAVRETREEVGVDLTRSEFLGYMGPFVPRNRMVRVVPAVYALTETVSVHPGPEVSSHRWVPFTELLSVTNRGLETVSEVPGVAVPSFRFGDYVVWGLTERILTSLAEMVERA